MHVSQSIAISCNVNCTLYCNFNYALTCKYHICQIRQKCPFRFSYRKLCPTWLKSYLVNCNWLHLSTTKNISRWLDKNMSYECRNSSSHTGCFYFQEQRLALLTLINAPSLGCCAQSYNHSWQAITTRPCYYWSNKRFANMSAKAAMSWCFWWSRGNPKRKSKKESFIPGHWLLLLCLLLIIIINPIKFACIY